MITVTEKVRFIESFLGRGILARNEKNFAVKCPFCGKPGSPKKKLVIHMDSDLCHCWVCGFAARSLVTLLRKFGTREQLRRYRERFRPGDSFVEGEDDEKPEVRLPHDFKLLTLAHSRDPDVRAAKSYLNSRGITERDMWYYRLGVSEESRWHRRIIVPSFDAMGKLNYFTARAIDRDQYLKYDSPSCDKLSVVFNEICIDWTRPVVLCEGPFDVFKCGENAVPLLGSELSDASRLLLLLIARKTPVVLALDADATKKAFDIAERLESYGVTVSIVRFDREGDDPGMMTKEQFAKARARAVLYDRDMRMMARLDEAVNVRLRI